MKHGVRALLGGIGGAVLTAALLASTAFGLFTSPFGLLLATAAIGFGGAVAGMVAYLLLVDFGSD